MSAIGFAITKLTSKFGLLSRKASVRLATNTGKRLVDKTNELGRALNKSEIEGVFAETLPKRCRPKILTEKEQVKEHFRKLHMTDDMAEAQMENMVAGAVPNGMGKRPLYIPLQDFDKDMIPPVTAHELEHGLEMNNRFKGKLQRRLLSILVLPRLIFDKNFANKITSLRVKISQLEEALQSTTFSGSEKLFSSAPTREGLAKSMSTDLKGLNDKIRQTIREVINPTNSATSKSEYAMSKEVLDIEIPAYKVEGEIDRYAMELGKNETSPHQALSMVYEDARKILKEEQRLFLKNKKARKLILPLQYKYDTDFSRLIPNEENRKFVMSIIKNPKDKEKFYDIISYCETDISALREFLNKNGLTIGKDVKTSILSIDAEVLKRDNIMSILKERKILID